MIAFTFQLDPQQVGAILGVLESVIAERQFAHERGETLPPHVQCLIDTHAEVERQWREHVRPSEPQP